jgi:hypothetical protein
MGKLACVICKREREESAMQVFTPTEGERASMKELGEDAPLDRYAYCKGCIQILKNPNTGLAFMKGVLKHHAKSAGAHPDLAEKAIDRFTVKLLDRARKN